MKSKLAMMYGIAAAMTGEYPNEEKQRVLTEEQLLAQRERDKKKAKQVKERNYKRQGLTKFTFDGKEIWALNETSARRKYSKL